MAAIVKDRILVGHGLKNDFQVRVEYGELGYRAVDNNFHALCHTGTTAVSPTQHDPRLGCVPAVLLCSKAGAFSPRFMACAMAVALMLTQSPHDVTHTHMHNTRVERVAHNA